MLDTVFYLLKMFAIGWHELTSSMGNTTLGFFIQIVWRPILGFLLTIAIVAGLEGKAGLVKHINKTLIIAACVAVGAELIVYIQMLEWRFFSAIYQDHVSLLQQVNTQTSRADRQKLSDAAEFLPIRHGLDNQISDFRAKCAGFEGEKSTLS